MMKNSGPHGKAVAPSVAWFGRMSPADKTPLSERRSDTRKRVILAGVITYKEGAFAFNCRIADLTETGAKLMVSQSENLPTDFFLINMRAQVAYLAHMAWRTSDAVGVELGAAIDLRNVPDKKYNYLARIWASRNTVNPSLRR
jgi:hypothetical protein